MAEDDVTPQETPPPATDDAAPPPELGDKGKQALDRMKAERDEARKQAKALADVEKRLKEYEDRDKTDAEKQTERVAAAEKRADESDRLVLQTKTALRHGLTEDEASDMSWSGTDDELDARAKRVVERRVAQPRFGGGADGGPRDTGKPKASTLQDAIAARITAGKT